MLSNSFFKNIGIVEGAIIISLICFAFSGDKIMVAVSYRGALLFVWNLSDGRCISYCKRAKEYGPDGRRVSILTWFAVDRFIWNPITGHVFGIYRDGCVFKWHPITEENVEARKAADEITASPDSKLFATSSTNGFIRV